VGCIPLPAPGARPAPSFQPQAMTAAEPTGPFLMKPVLPATRSRKRSDDLFIGSAPRPGVTCIPLPSPASCTRASGASGSTSPHRLPWLELRTSAPAWAGRREGRDSCGPGRPITALPKGGWLRGGENGPPPGPPRCCVFARPPPGSGIHHTAGNHHPASAHIDPRGRSRRLSAVKYTGTPRAASAKPLPSPASHTC